MYAFRSARAGVVGIIDINCDDLEWIDKEESLVRTNALATVYKGKLKRQQRVALKI